jgi:hypothetical protein
MEVHISLDDTRPPVGRLTVTRAPGAPDQAASSVPFTGWLGLLRALSDVLDPSGEASPGR